MMQLNLLQAFLSIFDIDALIRHGGLLLVALLVYGSTGLFFCFFVPASALLFTAGIFVATGGIDYSFYAACGLLVLATVLGNFTGYWFGWKTGPHLYKKEDTRFYKKQHLKTAETFYKKYGWLALTLGLYLPIIRTFAPVVAGIIRLDRRRFAMLSITGSLVWVTSFVAAGYFIGDNPSLKPFLKYIVLGFVVVVTVPLVIWTLKELKGMKRANGNKK
ncbi:MAG: VTT domain-containing protein [Chitinophagaceae bacterium]